MKFKIGETVRTVESNDKGTIVDILRSEATEFTFYRVQFQHEYRKTIRLIDEDSLVRVDEFDYSKVRFDMSIDNTIVVVRMMVGDKEIARNHGHMIHENELGVAQAASWALKCIYQKLLEENEENKENGGY
jgi:hypothetical protein